jgi:putative sigma-54 modulation protein
MKINTKATNLELTPAIQDYAEKKVQSLEKFLQPDGENVLAAIEIGVTTHHHKSGDIFRAELNLSNIATGEQFYAEAEKDDLYAAIDEMKDKAERECLTLKKKKLTLIKRGAARIKGILRSRG